MKKLSTPFLSAIYFLSRLFLLGIICNLQPETSYAQNYQWAKSIGSTIDDWGYSIAVDASGNVHVTGFFQGTADFDPEAGREVSALNDYFCFATNLFL